ncbi:hypothetical protein HRJ34_21200 [Rhizorhabdus wittichii]|uniref:Uncharacterized protein n=1 Tax=Rhizorhabdus wittichii TaxID=160791 RepID=A0A975D0V6_9SPHN|nr:hypothetical protein [Rhizorhabdus wittichii]QTH20814.1 hypothetical protein HRJ34_21200 [Rhizorhabdus wittichii]
MARVMVNLTKQNRRPKKQSDDAGRRASKRLINKIANPADGKPLPGEAKEIEAATERYLDRCPRAMLEYDESGSVVAPYGDRIGHIFRLMDALGTPSMDFANLQLVVLERACGGAGDGKDDVAVNAALAMIQAIGPKDELEAALAVQMAAAHALSLKAAGWANRTENIVAATAGGNLSVKMMRTFTAQIEALARLRGKGQQTVRVEHVTVQPGAQAIVGDVHQHLPGGGGGSKESKDQAHEQTTDAPIAALRRPDQSNHGVPIACDEKRPMQAAWRAEHRGAEG